MILSIEGDEKTGKSTLAYTAPLPIVSFSFDMGHGRALYGSQHDKLFKDSNIQVIKVGPKEAIPEPSSSDITVYVAQSPIQMDPKKTSGMMEFWAKWLPPILKAIQEPKGTLVIDTMTLLRSHRVAAHLEDTGQRQLLQIQYGIPNDSIRDLYTFCQSYEKDLVAIHHLRAKWGKVMESGKLVDGELPGEFEADGLSKTDKFVDVVLRMERSPKGAKSTMQGTLRLCGYNPSLEGTPLSDPTWNDVVGLIEAAGWAGEKFKRRV